MQEVVGGALPATAATHDLSMLGLFLQADPIVKGAMVLLAAGSVLCCEIIFDKVLLVLRLRREVRQFELLVAAERTTNTAHHGLGSTVLAAGRREEVDVGESRAYYRGRLERAMHAVVIAELRRIERGLPFLATVGSTAPFVGLFGTVWGIMNSFTAIAQSNDTSLAVVPRHRGGPVRHRSRSRRGDPGGGRLQQARDRDRDRARRAPRRQQSGARAGTYRFLAR